MPTLRSYYTRQFPIGVRTDKSNPESLTFHMDTARLQVLQDLENSIRQMGRQFQVLTADTSLEDYERFLRIPVDKTLSLSERRVRILTRFSGQPATITNIKIIAKEITGADIVIHEYGMPTDQFYDPDNHPWKVKIVVDMNAPEIKAFKPEYFESIMKQIFPAHTEWEADSFVYVAPESYLAPADAGKKEFVLDEDFLQFQGL